jgi:hypothetical protein
MKLFEYREVKPVNEYITQDELNDLGKQGWELVLCDVGTYIFKRELFPQPWENDQEFYNRLNNN